MKKRILSVVIALSLVLTVVAFTSCDAINDALENLLDGTLAGAASAEGVKAYILTGDRDSLQLISGKTRVLLATNTDTVTMDEAAFLEKYGVRADQYVDVKALMGDSSDNIPGVAGVGEKTAFKLIAEQGSLDAIYENLDAIKLTPSVRAKMENGKESAYMSKELATIMRNVPLDITLADVAHKGIDRPEAKKLFLRYNLLSAIKRLGLDKDIDEPVAASEKAEAASVTVSECADLSLLNGECYAISILDGRAYISDGDTVISTSICGDLADFVNSKKIITYDC